MSEKKQRKRIPIKSLGELSEVVKLPEETIEKWDKKLREKSANPPTYTMGWEDAKRDMEQGKLVRCTSWESDQFMWSHKARNKKIDIHMLHGPTTKEFLEKRGLKSMTISKHTNRWTGKGIWVGFHPCEDDRNGEWELYKD